jgi:hypothetical protein
MGNLWDVGAMPEPRPEEHPLHGLWTPDGKPAATAPPEQQHAAILGRLLADAASQPREARW